MVKPKGNSIKSPEQKSMFPVLFNKLFNKKRNQKQQTARVAENLYTCAMLNCRKRVFFQHAEVPDTFDGRFDLLLLHIFIIQHLLIVSADSQAKKISQALCDRMFADMDQSLREMGVGDVGVPKQIKRMVKAFNGRMQAYQEAVSDDAAQDSIEHTIARNLYGTVEDIRDRDSILRMGEFLHINASDKSPKRIKNLLQGQIIFDNHALEKAQDHNNIDGNKKRYDRIKKT